MKTFAIYKGKLLLLLLLLLQKCLNPKKLLLSWCVSKMGK